MEIVLVSPVGLAKMIGIEATLTLLAAHKHFPGHLESLISSPGSCLLLLFIIYVN